MRIRKCKGLQKIAWNSGFIPTTACGLQDDVILLCLASSTTPRWQNLLVALVQYTVTHFQSSLTKSSSWFLSSLLPRRTTDKTWNVSKMCFQHVKVAKSDAQWTEVKALKCWSNENKTKLEVWGQDSSHVHHFKSFRLRCKDASFFWRL